MMEINNEKKSQSNLFQDFTICDEWNKVWLLQNCTTTQNVQIVDRILADTEPDVVFLRGNV